MEHRILPRQRYAYLLTAVSAPLVAAASGLTWPWVLTVAMLAAAAAVGLFFLQKAAPAPLAELYVPLWGKGVGKMLLVLQAAFAALLLGSLALGAISAFPDQQTFPFLPLTLLAVCAWASWQGRAASVRAVGVLFFFLVALYGAVFFFAAPQVEPSRLLQGEQAPALLPLGVVLLLPLYGVHLTEPGKKEKFPTLWLLLFLLLPSLAAAFCTAIPGSNGRFYDMAKSIEVLSFAQRMEPLVSCAATVGWFSALSLTAATAGTLLQPAGVQPRWGALLACLAAVPQILVGKPVPAQILLPLGAVFCALLPLLTLGFGLRKKDEKFLKKPLDTGGGFC